MHRGKMQLCKLRAWDLGSHFLGMLQWLFKLAKCCEAHWMYHAVGLGDGGVLLI